MRDQVPELEPLHKLIRQSDSGDHAKEHRAILDGLRAHDPVATRTAMRAYFSRLLAAMLEATEGQALEESQRRAPESRERFLVPAQAA